MKILNFQLEGPFFSAKGCKSVFTGFAPSFFLPPWSGGGSPGCKKYPVVVALRAVSCLNGKIEGMRGLLLYRVGLLCVALLGVSGNGVAHSFSELRVGCGKQAVIRAPEYLPKRQKYAQTTITKMPIRQKCAILTNSAHRGAWSLGNIEFFTYL